MGIADFAARQKGDEALDENIVPFPGIPWPGSQRDSLNRMMRCSSAVLAVKEPQRYRPALPTLAKAILFSANEPEAHALRQEWADMAEYELQSHLMLLWASFSIEIAGIQPHFLRAHGQLGQQFVAIERVVPTRIGETLISLHTGASCALEAARTVLSEANLPDKPL